MHILNFSDHYAHNLDKVDEATKLTAFTEKALQVTSTIFQNAISKVKNIDQSKFQNEKKEEHNLKSIFNKVT